ncbi:SRPBCC family protein [Actinomadura formosensis]|uniref:SRPBCC family protein n=1 Tax=Actinomadura formosensis TaxID=60706 RepID=UPI000836CFE8|nr:SRPBCC family protein [Actinomadura formosensis]
MALQFTAKVAAPAEAVFDLIADAPAWPQFFRPEVHAEYLSRGDGSDLLRRWFLTPEQDAVRVRTYRRVLDRGALRIAFENDEERTTGAWTFTPLSPDETGVELRYEPGSAGGSVPAELASEAAAWIDGITRAAEPPGGDLGDLVLSFEDTLFIGGAAADAYAVLYEADKWPERIEHVARLDMSEDVPGIQFFDMDTRTPDGAEHTTRSVRVCLPERLIVYKQINLPKLLAAHTGHWRFTPTREGLIAGARHTVTVKPSALGILGPDATVEDARRYLRRVLGANSTKNLQLAKRWAEDGAAQRASG